LSATAALSAATATGNAEAAPETLPTATRSRSGGASSPWGANHGHLLHSAGIAAWDVVHATGVVTPTATPGAHLVFVGLEVLKFPQHFSIISGRTSYHNCNRAVNLVQNQDKNARPP
jgi:hypothetical protein